MKYFILSQVNWIAVLVAAIGYFAMGALWYSRAFFGLKWAKLREIDVNNDAAQNGMIKIMIASFLCMLISCTALALLIVRLDLFVFSSALIIGTLAGLGFSGMSIAISLVYQRKPLVLYLIECGYHLAGNIVAATILVLWR